MVNAGYNSERTEKSTSQKELASRDSDQNGSIMVPGLEENICHIFFDNPTCIC